VVQNVKTFKMLAEVYGVIEETLKEINMDYYVIPPVVWKATVKIAGKGREAEKKLAQKYIVETYGRTCTEDEADAACLGTHVIKKENSEFDWA
jgi:Holliday junction resolvasome RuvABC endonuclease subunit